MTKKRCGTKEEKTVHQLLKEKLDQIECEKEDQVYEIENMIEDLENYETDVECAQDELDLAKRDLLNFEKEIRNKLE